MQTVAKGLVRAPRTVFRVVRVKRSANVSRIVENSPVGEFSNSPIPGAKTRLSGPLALG